LNGNAIRVTVAVGNLAWNNTSALVERIACVAGSAGDLSRSIGLAERI